MKIYSVANAALLAAALSLSAPGAFAQAIKKSALLGGDAAHSPEDASPADEDPSTIQGAPGLDALAVDSDAAKVLRGASHSRRLDSYCPEDDKTDLWTVKLYSNGAPYAGSHTRIKFYAGKAAWSQCEWYWSYSDWAVDYGSNGKWGSTQLLTCDPRDGRIFPTLDVEELNIVICNDGPDGLYIDKMELYKKNRKQMTWGVTNDKGYCISTDSGDSTFGDRGSCSSGAFECISFNGDGTVERGVREPHSCQPEHPCYLGWNWVH